jgi:hypothetical protein
VAAEETPVHGVIDGDKRLVVIHTEMTGEVDKGVTVGAVVVAVIAVGVVAAAVAVVAAAVVVVVVVMSKGSVRETQELAAKVAEQCHPLTSLDFQ